VLLFKYTKSSDFSHRDMIDEGTSLHLMLKVPH